MIQIAGGILIAYLAIITMGIWLPLLLILGVVVIGAVVCFLMYEYIKEEPSLLFFTVIPVYFYMKNKLEKIKKQKIVKRIGLARYIRLRILRVLRYITKRMQTTIQNKINICYANLFINILLSLVYAFICTSPVYVSIAFLNSEYENTVLLLCLALSAVTLFFIFIKYPHKAFKKITRDSKIIK